MDFPAFSSICSSNKAECDVNAVWISVDFLLLLSVCPGILCRWEDEERKRQRVKERKRGRGKETKGRREEETKGREDENRVTSYSPPIHLLFVSSSPPLHRPIRSNLIQFVSKNICEIRVQNSFTPGNTASWEFGEGERRWQSGSGRHRKVEGTVRVGGKGRGCAVNLNYNTASSNNVFVRNPHIFIFHMTIFI